MHLPVNNSVNKYKELTSIVIYTLFFNPISLTPLEDEVQ
jgi:hypothetical protein